MASPARPPPVATPPAPDPAGAEAVRLLGERLRASAWRPQRVFVSPLKRARETAEIVTAAAGVVAEIELTPALEPERRPEDVAATLGLELDGAAHALLVGHQPLLGLLAGYWGGAVDGLAPGELVALEFAGPVRPGAARIVERIGGP